jgi:hypothetical protein
MTITSVLRPVDGLRHDVGQSTNGQTLHYLLLNIPNPNFAFADSIAEYLQYEISSPGYSRKVLDATVLTGPPVLTDSVTKSAYREWVVEYPLASGESMTWNAEAFILQGVARTPKAVTFTASSNAVNLTNHLLGVGEPITFSGSLPTSTPQITEGELYYAQSISANQFEVRTVASGGTGIVFSAAGSGSLIYAKGILHSIGVHSSMQTFSASGGSVTRQIITRLGVQGV